MLPSRVMAQLALTRASTIGPIVALVRQGGASVERVFAAAQLPMRLSEKPDALIPLRDQFKLLECAARALGDHALPARLSTSAGPAGLGKYGEQFLAARSLRAAINRGNAIFTSTLQSATTMYLSAPAREARWAYQVAEPEQIGQQKNAILAIGYMLILLREFLGASWVPNRVEAPGGALQGRAATERLFRCEIIRGGIAAVVFPSDSLEASNPGRLLPNPLSSGAEIPSSADFPGYVQEVIRLGLLDDAAPDQALDRAAPRHVGAHVATSPQAGRHRRCQSDSSRYRTTRR